MKHLFTLIIASLLGSSLLAQNRQDTIREISTDKHRVETNKFGSNWFIGAGVGQQMFFGDHNKQTINFVDRLSMAYEVYFGKWFTPGIGVRLAGNGLMARGLTAEGAYTTGKNAGVESAFWLTEQEIKYFHAHGDVMFNITQLIGGYKEDRFYQLSPYLGLGIMAATAEPYPNDPSKKGKPREISSSIGLLNSFRVSNVVDLTLDVRGSMVNDRFDGETGNRRQDGLLTAAVGIKYNFNKRNWDKPTNIVIHKNEADVQKLRESVTRLANDNESLKKQIASANGKTITEIKVEKSVLAAPILVTFPINKSILSNEARVNLGFFAKIIKEGGSNIVYQVTGYADRGTGTTSTNERLSKERAEAIYNVLVREFGVNPAQLKVQHRGGVDNMYYDDPRLSRAVIVIAD